MAAHADHGQDREPDGAVKILVAVADVDATVRRDSPIEEHARHNTTSVYTAAEIFPMLPERLSTDLTSLASCDPTSRIAPSSWSKTSMIAQLPGGAAQGHFGLAVNDYTHSTAPHRRFPDLITQRLLKAAIVGEPMPYSEEQLRALARRNVGSRNWLSAQEPIALPGRGGEIGSGMCTITNIQSVSPAVRSLFGCKGLLSRGPALASERRNVVMPTLKAAAALKHLVQTKLDALGDTNDEDERLFAHEIAWHVPDEDGRNWDINGYRGPADCATAVRLLIDRLRREYRLDTEEAGDPRWLE